MPPPVFAALFLYLKPPFDLASIRFSRRDDRKMTVCPLVSSMTTWLPAMSTVSPVVTMSRPWTLSSSRAVPNLIFDGSPQTGGVQLFWQASSATFGCCRVAARNAVAVVAGLGGLHDAVTADGAVGTARVQVAPAADPGGSQVSPGSRMPLPQELGMQFGSGVLTQRKLDPEESQVSIVQGSSSSQSTGRLLQVKTPAVGRAEVSRTRIAVVTHRGRDSPAGTRGPRDRCVGRPAAGPDPEQRLHQPRPG